MKTNRKDHFKTSDSVTATVDQKSNEYLETGG